MSWSKLSIFFKINGLAWIVFFKKEIKDLFYAIISIFSKFGPWHNLTSVSMVVITI